MSVEQQQQQQQPQAAQEGSAQAQQTQIPANAAAPENESTDLKAEAKSDSNVAAVEAGVAALSIPQPQAELHRACAEGRLEDVRSILGRGLDALETLGKFIRRSGAHSLLDRCAPNCLGCGDLGLLQLLRLSSRYRGCFRLYLQ